MAKYHNINNSMIHKIRSNASQIFEKESDMPHVSRKLDLQLLELLITTNDIDTQLKLFSSLSVCLMFNKDTSLDVIIKCNAVYDKVHEVLSKGLPRKATVALNFLSALLFVDAEDDSCTLRKTLASYARNMTRSSGCLAIMIDMFTNCMMYLDTWKALCQCIAIVCNSCEINQSYCTHVIPVCIRKCSQANMDVLLVLQSLLLNHNKNIQLFLDCNGITIFTREMLHYDKCLQLLTTVVICSTKSSLLLRETRVTEHLQEFVHLYGPGSQIGQTAMIILNQINSRARENYSQDTNTVNTRKKSKKMENLQDKNYNKEGKKMDDTKALMQNVMKEIFSYQQNELKHLKKAPFNREPLIRKSLVNRNVSCHRHIRHGKTLNETKNTMDHIRKNRSQCNIDTSLSFSFLQKNDSYTSTLMNRTECENKDMNKCKRIGDGRNKLNPKSMNAQTLDYIQDLSGFCKSISDERPDIDFRPFFSSTPIHKTDNMEQYINYSKISIPKSNITIRTQVTPLAKAKIQKRKLKKVCHNKDMNIRNRSLSSRFLSALNESCTTLVKTVANIFKKKEASAASEDSKITESLPVDNDQSCSYSFLKYMQKREVLMSNTLFKNRNSNRSDFSLGTKSCETCDDTEVLKKKLANDEHLKQTLKKLKLGINLYGCDFKKISRTIWPRESYMTPVVLYNLYRKLILK